MSLTLRCAITAMGYGKQTSFNASGGTEPYVYSVLPNGVGGSINSSTGVYTSPVNIVDDPKKSSDIIQVIDDDGVIATLPILVTTPLGLVCDILQSELGLGNGRVYLWDQKINQPKDEGLYIAVSVMTCEPFGNVNKYQSGVGLDSVQSVNMKATLALDIISRGPAALNRKEEVVMAFNSNYAQSQQELNSFYISRLSPRFLNLSQIDGAAIPYRFNITVNIQYFVKKIKSVPYFDTFADDIETES